MAKALAPFLSYGALLQCPVSGASEETDGAVNDMGDDATIRMASSALLDAIDRFAVGALVFQ